MGTGSGNSPFQSVAPDISSPYRGGGAGAQAHPPPRTGPVWLIVVSLFSMFVVAPILLVALLFSGIGISNVMDGSLQVPNGGQVTVDEQGVFGTAILDGGPASCLLTDQSGTDFPLRPEGNQDLLVVRDLQPGTYTLHCEGVQDGQIMPSFQGALLNNLVPMTTKAFGWSSLLGFAGLIGLITGIVWLVKRNRARKEFFQAHMRNY